MDVLCTAAAAAVDVVTDPMENDYELKSQSQLQPLTSTTDNVVDNSVLVSTPPIIDDVIGMSQSEGLDSDKMNFSRWWCDTHMSWYQLAYFTSN